MLGLDTIGKSWELIPGQGLTVAQISTAARLPTEKPTQDQAHEMAMWVELGSLRSYPIRRILGNW